jgi:hypothetical protein
MPPVTSRQAVRIAIFAGTGTSHSWIWLTDILERSGYCDVACIDEHAVRRCGLGSYDVLFVSGGDTFAIAEGLGREGARAIDAFVASGGTYIGACAGTYLVLHSSLSPLDSFNFVKARITNLAKHLPPARQASEKYCTEYGCRYIFHPVREDVCLKPAAGAWDGMCGVVAPLYGGPGMTASEDIEVLATYAGFTENTEFLVDESLAGETLIGSVAAAKKAYGAGCFYLFGPHLEHPGYCAANRILLSIVDSAGSCASDDGHITKNLQPGRPAHRTQVRDFVSRISNARIIALALERSPSQWLVGRKVYDAQRIRVFLEALWQRAQKLLRLDPSVLPAEDVAELLRESAAVVERLHALRADAGHASRNSRDAEELVAHVRKLTALFMTRYFQLRGDGFFDDERRRACTCILKQPQPCIQ